MTKSPVGAFAGPFPAAFRRRSTFVAGAFLQARRDGYGARGSDLDDERQKHPAPTAEPPWAVHRRST